MVASLHTCHAVLQFQSLIVGPIKVSFFHIIKAIMVIILNLSFLKGARTNEEGFAYKLSLDVGEKSQQACSADRWGGDETLWRNMGWKYSPLQPFARDPLRNVSPQSERFIWMRGSLAHCHLGQIKARSSLGWRRHVESPPPPGRPLPLAPVRPPYCFCQSTHM